MRRAATISMLGVWMLTIVATIIAADDAPPKKPKLESKSDAKLAAKVEGTSEADEIRAGSREFVAAFNKHDAKAVAALWTAGGEYVDDAGRSYDGRDAIAKGYAAMFAKNPTAKIRVMVDSIKLLGEQSALEEGRTFLDPPGAGEPGVGKYVAVHVKDDGKWKMASVRETWVPSASTHVHVADFGWMVGTWTAEERGVKVESDCRWIADNSFVERRYKTTNLDGTITAGVQIIGWNPQQRAVQSWNFSHDGGHATGYWTPVENGWSAEIRGMTGDGTPTWAMNTIVKIDDNAFTWKSSRRAVGDQQLSDLPETLFKRQPTAK